MKMKYYVMFFVALYVQSCSNQKIESGWTIENLKGKVLRYSEFSFKAEYRFGNIEKGKRKRQNNYKYDEQNKYNEKGNKIESNSFYSDGRLKSKYTYKYNEKGNKIESNRYYSDGRLTSKSTYKYDEKGNHIEENSYNSDGRLTSKITNKYDKKGNEIEYNISFSDRLGIKSTFKYDEKGNKIGSNDYNYYSDGLIINTKSTYKYDEKGNKIEENEYKSDGRLISKCTFNYEFDNQGNWIKMIVFIDEIPKFILEREYEYYD